MPIFEKDGKRIYFAHVPKAGGTSIYCAFAQSGWRIYNITKRDAPHTAFQILTSQYEVGDIAQSGRTWRYPYSLQHSPRAIWRTWGPFDESFAIIRDPLTRFTSSLAYHYRYNPGLQASYGSCQALLDSVLDQISRRRFAKYKLLDGHLIPQRHLVSRRSVLFGFESDWAGAIEKRYGLGDGTIAMVNAGEKQRPDLRPEQKSQLQFIYRKDIRLHRRVIQWASSASESEYRHSA